MKLLITLIAFALSLNAFAQVPQKMNYQAVIRGADNNLLTETTVGMKISIIRGFEDGPVVYSETHEPTTNGNGLVSLEIGTGTVVEGSFTTIYWADGTFFVKSETDPEGGSNYTISGTSQLSSVPYSLYAESVANADDADADPTNEIQELSINDYELSIGEGNTVALPRGNADKAHAIWLSPLSIVPTLSSTGLTVQQAQSPSTSARITSTELSPSLWVQMGVPIASYLKIDSVTICYEKLGDGTFISQVRLTNMVLPTHAAVKHDDATNLVDAGPTCYTSRVHVLYPVEASGTINLILRVQFSSIFDWIDIGGIAIHVSPIE